MQKFDSSFFVVRTPLLSAEILERFNELVDNADQRSNYLATIFNDPLIKEGLYLASPILYRETIKYLDGAITQTKSIRKIEESLIEYLVRMCGRPTPFGLFAGCSVGEFGDGTAMSLEGDKSFQRHVRFDMDFLFSVYKKISVQPGIAEAISYRINNSLYQHGNELRYVEYINKNGKRRHNLVKIPADAVMNKILKQARQYQPFGNLVDIIQQLGHSEEDSKEFILSLIENQVLKSELEPNVTGEPYTTILSGKLKSLNCTDPFVLAFLDAEKMLLEIDPEKPLENILIYSAISEKLKAFLPDLNEAKLFQVDLYKPTKKSTVDISVREQLIEGIHALHKMNGFFYVNSQLEKFKRAFFEKYEYRPVKLVEAMDNEIGLGFKSAMSTSEYYNKYQPEFSPTMAFKMEKFYSTLLSGKRIVELNEDDIRNLPEPKYPLPTSFAAMCSILKNEEGYTVSYKGLSGPSGANLLGRFCHSSDELEKQVKDLCSKEELLDPDSVFAEVVHLPESRIGNILTRPVLRSYEIPYLANTTVDDKHIIEIDDLYLMMSPGGREIILFSKSLNKRVYPRLSTAHNFVNANLPIYNFICEYQFQHIQHYLKWEWWLLDSRPFLPRVQYKNIIISVAKWNISATDLKEVFATKDVNKRCDALQAFLRERNVPDQVLLLIGENEFPLDLSRKFYLEYLIKQIEKMAKITLRENLSTSGNLLMESHRGSHFNEFIIPFGEEKEKPAEQNLLRPAFDTKGTVLSARTQRKFHPGSELIYLKIYLPPQTADGYLIREMNMLLRKLRSKGMIRNSFFIRYGDPHFHLRLRMYTAAPEFLGEILQLFNKLNKKALSSGVVHRLMIDTYERELERYGHDSIHVSEDIFSADSAIVIDFLNGINNRPDADRLKFLFGISIAMLYTDIIFPDVRNKKTFVDGGFEFYGTEFGVLQSKSWKKDLSNLYRTNARDIQMLETNSFDNQLIQQLTRRHRRSVQKDLSLLKESRFKDISKDSVKLLMSYIHMFYNRLFSRDQRREELKLYYLLSNYYKSVIVRHENSTGVKAEQ